MDGTWHTIKAAAELLRVSERTIRRRITTGEIESKKENGVRLVRVDKSDNSVGQMAEQYIEQLRSEVAYLRLELDTRNEEVSKLNQQLEQGRERSDTIILQLTRQLESQQKLGF